MPGESDSPQDESGTGTETETGTQTTSEGGSQAIDGWLSGTSNYGGSAADMTGSNSVEVQIGASGDGGNFVFAPPAIRVSSGTTVTWTWTGEGGAHNVVAKSGAFDSGSPQSGSGVTFEHTFENSGTALYRCEPHASLGMNGAVVVE